MSLNIKNERVHALAREAARLTNQSQTSAVEEALTLLIATHSGPAEERDRARRLDVLRTVSLQWAPGDDKTAGRISEVEDLYDPSTGLPR